MASPGFVVAHDNLGRAAEVGYPVDRVGHHSHIQVTVVARIFVVGGGDLQQCPPGGADHDGAHPQVGLQARRRLPGAAGYVDGHRPSFFGRRDQRDLKLGCFALHHLIAERVHVRERHERDVFALVAGVYLLDVLENLLGGAGVELLR